MPQSGHDVAYHGFAVGVGRPDQDPRARAIAIRQAIDDLPDDTDNIEMVPVEDGGSLEGFEFYDMNTGELVIIVRALYRRSH